MDAVDKINLRLKKMLSYVARLKKFVPVTVKELRDNDDKSSIIERNLQLACEAVLDVANLLSAEFRFPPAEDNKESIVILGKEGVLDKKFAEKFKKMAGFRNILVHDYLEIDYGKVAGIMNEGLIDFEKFAKAVARYLK